MFIRIKRVLIHLWFNDIWRIQPLAVIHWRYLLLKPPAPIRLHRKLWWRTRYKLPRMFWLPMEILRWPLWYFWLGPRQLRKAMQHYGGMVEQQFGVSVAEQGERMGALALHYGICPFEAYAWQLFRPQRMALDYIFAGETQALHVLMNGNSNAMHSQQKLLGDKIALAELLSPIGIPMVETAMVSWGDWRDLLSALQRYPELFCKLRSGNQGESAFAVWHEDNGLAGLAHDGKKLQHEHDVHQAWQTLASKGELLIQPKLQNHPSLALASPSGAAITVRLITRVVDGRFELLCSYLEVPAEPERLDDTRSYWAYPINADSGFIEPMPGEQFFNPKCSAGYRQAIATIDSDNSLPFWPEIISHSSQAHALATPDCWAIAWDWVISADGPILLEGNSGWGLEIPQMQMGGFANIAK